MLFNRYFLGGVLFLALIFPHLGFAEDQDEKTKYGKTWIQIGLAKPQFDDELGYWDKSYGDENLYPTFRLDYLPFSGPLTVGASLGLSYYKKSGKALVAKTDVEDPRDADDYSVDKSSKLEMTMIPVEVSATTQLRIPGWNYILFNGWYGFKRTYITGQREFVGDPDGGEAGSSYTKAWNNEQVYGVSFSFNLDALDRRSIYSLRSMGLKSIYFTPFYEVTTLHKNKRSAKGLDRKAIGAYFTFESF